MTIHGKPVLVATDLCARTDRAVDWATQLAREWDVRLMVLHAIEPDSRLHARPKLANEAMREVLPDPRADVDILPASGPAPTAIVDAAKSADCALIVTGVARFNHLGGLFHWHGGRSSGASRNDAGTGGQTAHHTDKF